MEKVLEGHLDDVVTKLDGLTEKSIMYVMRQVFAALNYLHKKNIAHRDLKVENIMVSKIEPFSPGSEDMKLQIKLIDFGLAQFTGGSTMDMQIGTQNWMAPELFADNPVHDTKVDVWAAGVLAFYLCGGCVYPFDSDSEFDGSNEEQCKEEVRQKILSAEPDWESANPFKPTAKAFIMKCLTKDPAQRWTADQALKNEIVKSVGSVATRA